MALAPDPLDVGTLADLRGCLAGAHSLLLDVDDSDPRRWEIFSVWLAPDGGGATGRGRLSGARLRQVADGTSGSYAWTQQQWGELGAALLPPALLDYLDRPETPAVIDLVVVAVGALASIPIAALPLRSGHLLVDRARLCQTPSLRFLQALVDRERPPHQRTAAAYLDPDLESTSIEGAALSALGDPGPDNRRIDVERLRSYGDVCRVLAAENGLLFLTLSAHGNGREGLAHAIEVDGQDFTAAAALRLNFPSLVIAAACWSAKVRSTPGTEPWGLPTVMLSRGSRWFVGGQVAVEDTGTAEILAAFYAATAAGRPPSEALRDAQLDYLARHGREVPPRRWAALALIGVPGIVDPVSEDLGPG
ncbi:CHAT domain-containing protein [Micromonospora sp. NPDC049274]|uniref:CHAT domain-containing protein n=1 Tax=Micromonospora sp. NPDC049274 TaxID=3154829 RepID=UPI0034188737